MGIDLVRKRHWRRIGLIAAGQSVFTAVLVVAIMVFHRYFSDGFPLWMKNTTLTFLILLAGIPVTYILYRRVCKVRRPGLIALAANPLTFLTLFCILFNAAVSSFTVIHNKITYTGDNADDRRLDSLYAAQRDPVAVPFGRAADSLVIMYLERSEKTGLRVMINRDFSGRVTGITVMNPDSGSLCLIGELTRVRELSLLGPSGVDTLPPSLGKLTRLVKLTLDSMHLKELPAALTGNKQLTSVLATNNNFERFPDVLLSLDSLKVLGLEHNRITRIPESIAALAKLERLEMANNLLEGAPSSIGRLKNLKNLNLSGNKITDLPEEIGGITGLETLNVVQNRLESIPESFAGLTALTSFSFYGNPIREGKLHQKVVAFLDRHSSGWRGEGSSYSILRFWDEVGLALINRRLARKRLTTYKAGYASSEEESFILVFDTMAVELALQAAAGPGEWCKELDAISYESLGPAGVIHGLYHALYDLERHPRLISLLNKEIAEMLQGTSGSNNDNLYYQFKEYPLNDNMEKVRRLKPFYLFWAAMKRDGSFDSVKDLFLRICASCTSIIVSADTTVSDKQTAEAKEPLPATGTLSEDSCRAAAGRIRDEIEANCNELSRLAGYYSWRVRCSFIDDPDGLPDSIRALHDSITTERRRCEDRTFAQIQCYTKILASPHGMPGLRPSLLYPDSIAARTRFKSRLPKTKPSEFMKDNPFFFLGAGPFFSDPYDEAEAKMYRNLQNEPEMRLLCNSNLNTLKVMDMVLGRDSGEVETRFGGEISQGHHEECLVWPKAVKGIGSLTHSLKSDFPVYLICEKGVITGRLVRVAEKLFSAQQGCTSDFPDVVVGFKTLPKGEILAMYVPYKPVSLDNCRVTRKKNLWTADLNGDGVDDIASVISHGEGVSGVIYTAVWYANISGQWRIIDFAEDLDCT